MGLVSSSLSEDQPQYLQKDADARVRESANTRVFTAGKLEETRGNVIASTKTSGIVDKWVPITDWTGDKTTEDFLWYQIPYNTGTPSKRGWVRGDVVTVKNALLEKDEKKRVFPNISPKNFAGDGTLMPRASTTAGQVVPMHKYPNRKAPVVARLEGFAQIVGQSSNSPLWYQLQLTDTRRGWVLADQVTAHDTKDLDKVKPQLRRRSGSTAAIPVRNGPAATETVLTVIGAADTGWHALQGRDAVHPDWWKIRYVGPIAGWVHKDHIQTHGSLNGLGVTWMTIPQVSLRSTATLGLNVRSGPGTSHAKVGFIPGRSTVKYDILGKDAATATWYQIRYSPTVVGWVHGGFVRTHGSLTGLTVTAVPQLSLKATTTLGLNVRSGPGTTHSQVGSIAGGSTDRYDILGKDAATATWYQIRFSDTITGWVHSNYIQTHGDLTGLEVTAVPQLSLKATTTLSLNVRSGPAATNAKVGFIAGGSTAKYDILGKDAATAIWYQIRFSSAVTGWVHGNYIQTHGDLSGLGVTWVPQLSLKTTATNGLAVHAGPGTTHAQTAFIASGSTKKYDIMGKDAATATWYQIRSNDTVDGWGAVDDTVETGGNLDLAPPPQVGLANTAQNCAVRATPATTGTLQATITDGTKRYPVLEKDAATAAWYKIRFSDSITGWVQTSRVRLHGDGRNLPIAGSPTTDNQPRLNLKNTVTAGLNLRSGPGTTHRILLTLPAGTSRYEILGKDADTTTWYEIRYGEGITGWVHKDYIQTHGSLAGLTVTWNPAPQLGPPDRCRVWPQCAHRARHRPCQGRPHHRRLHHQVRHPWQGCDRRGLVPDPLRRHRRLGARGLRPDLRRTRRSQGDLGPAAEPQRGRRDRFGRALGPRLRPRRSRPHGRRFHRPP